VTGSSAAPDFAIRANWRPVIRPARFPVYAAYPWWASFSRFCTAKSLKEHAAVSHSEASRKILHETRSESWLRAAEWAMRSEQDTAGRLDDPRLHWHAVRSGEIMESLVTWLREQMHVKTDRTAR
jgi:hypothetical protein